MDTGALLDIRESLEMPRRLEDLKVKIFADGADKKGIMELCRDPYIKGFTTNPTLMQKAGVSNYRGFADEILKTVHSLPFSFEVFADDFDEMERQAMDIAEWGDNVYVKIPVTNTNGESCAKLIEKLAGRKVRLNVTALMTLEQVRRVSNALGDNTSSFVSVFAGRIADTGVDPLPLMVAAVDILRPYPEQELIWASPRELFNVFQADDIGCHIITVTHDILQKLDLVGKNLTEYSLETVQMFYRDGRKVGFSL